MAGRLEGKVALISGVARGQGRSHAVRLASEGADIIGFDLCEPIATAPYDLSTPEDLAATESAIEALDRRALLRQADVRDQAALDALVADAREEFGHIDIVVANAGIQSFGAAWEMPEDVWQEMLDINLTGVWRTVKAAVPSMIEAERGGSVIMTSSFAGLHAIPNMVHYTAAKHGVTGLSEAFAVELAPYNIRSNSIHPSTVRSPMTDNQPFFEYFLGSPDATREKVEAITRSLFALPTSWIEVEDISSVVAFLASDEARFITASAITVDGGARMPFRQPHLN